MSFFTINCLQFHMHLDNPSYQDIYSLYHNIHRVLHWALKIECSIQCSTCLSTDSTQFLNDLVFRMNSLGISLLFQLNEPLCCFSKTNSSSLYVAKCAGKQILFRFNISLIGYFCIV